jgi:WD40 repeat protein
MNLRIPIALTVLGLAAPLAAQGMPTIQWVAAGDEVISTASVTPDGQTLVTSSYGDHTIKLWNAADASFKRTLEDQYGQIQSHALSPDGSKLVSGGEFIFGLGQSNMLVWDLASGNVLTELNGSVNLVFGVAWSPNGSRIAAGDQFGRIFLWNAATGAVVLTIPEQPGFASVFDVTFSPDGTRIAAGLADNTVRIYSTTTGALQKTLTGHTFFVQAVAFSPDGTRLASGSWDGTARIWDAVSGTSLHTLTGHNDLVYSVNFAPGGQTLATGGWDGSVRLWNVSSGAPLQSITAPGMDSVFDARFTPDGTQLAVGSVDGHPRIFPVAPHPAPLVFGHHTASIRALDVSADGERLVSASTDMTGKLFDPADGTELITLVGHFDVVNAVSVSDDHLLIATGAGSPGIDTKDPSVRLWNGLTGELLFTMPGHEHGTTGVDLTDDKTIVASGGRDGLVKFWNTANGALLSTLPGQTGGVRALAYSPDGTLLAVAASTKIRLFDATTHALVKTLSDVNVVSALSWAPDGHSLLAGLDAYDDNVRLWNVDSGTITRTFPGDEFGFIESVAFNPDGQTIASASGYTGQYRTWFVADGTLLKMYDEETGTHGINPELPLAYTPDGRLAYGRTDPTIVMTTCDGSIESYGAGTAGSGGFVPDLDLGGCASPGGTLSIAIHDALGGSQAVLLMGLTQASVPLKGGTLLVGSLLPTFVVLPLGGAGAGNGSIELQALLPPNTPVASLALQAWVVDPGGPKGFAASQGVLLGIE